ncbi:MAG: RNA polymerase sigma factor [Planctomycetota bacterium]|jgi:RNA polymerase sigma-70 factor (ECF subfamily)
MARKDKKSTAQPIVTNITNDELLVKRFKAGDALAFDQIVEQYSTDVATLANRLSGWRGDVQDIVQDVFLAAFVALKRFRSDSSLRTWLFTITTNKCRTHRYRQMLRLKFFSRVEASTGAGTVPGADKEVMDDEKSSRIRRAVMALPDKYREPVVLRYLQELSTKEICRVLDISESNLHTRLSRAREKLKENLAELIVE